MSNPKELSTWKTESGPVTNCQIPPPFSRSQRIFVSSTQLISKPDLEPD